MANEIAVQREPDMMSLLQLAIEKDSAIDVIERLAKIQTEMMDRTAKQAFSEAFARFKAKVPAIVKDSVIEVKGTIRSRYAKLDQVAEKVIPALLRVGITHRWKTRTVDDGRTFVTCYLRHTLGYEEEGSTLAFMPDSSGSMNPLQGLGSTVSYLERYTFVASCGIVIKDWDNDGNTGMSEDNLQERSKRLAEMARAEGIDKLTALYRANVKDAMAAKDYEGIKLFDQARDKRRAELNA